MAWSDINSLAQSDKFELVAVADVDARNFARVKEAFPAVKTYTDWRELLEKEGEGLDSVNVSTPDHMHGPVAMDAMALGLHVYGQKPLAQNLKECRAMQLRAEAKGVKTQMGIQISSGFTERLAVRLIQDGAIGTVKEVHSFSNKRWGDPDPRPDTTDEPPAELDWDGWLGVATERPYINGYYHPGNWRKRRDFGTGTLGDMGCHMFSAWYRALKLTAPTTVRSTGPAPNAHNWAVDATIAYEFPGTEVSGGEPISVIWYDGASRPPEAIASAVGGELPGQGSVFIGSEGNLVLPHISTPRLFPAEKFEGFRYPKLEPRDHYLEFVDACLSGGDEQPSAHFGYSAPLTEAVLLGCLATAFPDETLKWDAAKLAFKDHAEADALVTRTYRKGWEIAGL